MRKASSGEARRLAAASIGPRAYGFERALKRLHHEGQRIEDGGDDQAAEGKGESVAGNVDPEATQKGRGAEDDEQVEAEHGGRQDERQRRDCLDGGLEARGRRGEPPGDGRPQDEQDDGGDERQMEREPERSEVGHGSVHGVAETFDDGAGVLRLQVVEEGERGGVVDAALEQDGVLADGRVEVLRDIPSAALLSIAGAEHVGQRDEADIGVAGGDEGRAPGRCSHP